MDELPDYEIQRTVGDPGETAPPPQRPTGLWLVVALLIAAVGSATYVVFRRRPLPPPASNSLSKPHAVADAPSPRSLGGKGEQIAIPPLDQSDPVVRSLVRDLSSHPVVAKWLTGSGLVRDFAIVIARMADGTSPARFLTVLRPSLPFRTVERKGNVLHRPTKLRALCGTRGRRGVDRSGPGRKALRDLETTYSGGVSRSWISARPLA